MPLPKFEIFYGDSPKTATEQAPGGSPPNANTVGWITWRKPKGATTHFFLCVGGGGGGAAGFAGLTTIGRGGGGGGASAGAAKLIIPSFVLPKTLYLFPGFGGKGGAGTAGSGDNGAQPSRSIVADKPNTLNTNNTRADTLLISGTGDGFGGAKGDGLGADAGGPGETIATNALGIYQGLGVWAALAGLTAGGSVAFTAGQSLTYGSSGLLLTAGCGGGSITSGNIGAAGGNITGAGLVPTLTGGATGAAGGDGQNGYRYTNPFINTGGSGGGGGTTTTGGNGGQGAPGCGGGGGGAGVTFGGSGGDGGPGFIVIVSW